MKTNHDTVVYNDVGSLRTVFVWFIFTKCVTHVYKVTYILVCAQCFKLKPSIDLHTIEFPQLCSIFISTTDHYDSDITIIRVEFMLILQ